MFFTDFVEITFKVKTVVKKSFLILRGFKFLTTFHAVLREINTFEYNFFVYLQNKCCFSLDSSDKQFSCRLMG